MSASNEDLTEYFIVGDDDPDPAPAPMQPKLYLSISDDETDDYLYEKINHINIREISRPIQQPIGKHTTTDVLQLLKALHIGYKLFTDVTTIKYTYKCALAISDTCDVFYLFLTHECKGIHLHEIINKPPRLFFMTDQECREKLGVNQQPQLLPLALINNLQNDIKVIVDEELNVAPTAALIDLLPLCDDRVVRITLKNLFVFFEHIGHVPTFAKF